MKTVRARMAADEITTTFYVDREGDIFEDKIDAELLGLAGTVTVPSFFVGTLDKMRAYALQLYNA